MYGERLRMMSTVWSSKIQGIDTLYLSRKLRFDDRFKYDYMKHFDLPQSDIKVLEIGCGPGALSESLKRWYPNAEITGVDRDELFIQFAKDNINNVNFIIGDISKLPFDDESFDVVISNTVCEHVETSVFFNEQRRILKPEGICICLSNVTNIRRLAKCIENDVFENNFWAKLETDRNELASYNLAKYKLNEAELSKQMEQYKFHNVSSDYVTQQFTPDHPASDRTWAITIIESELKTKVEILNRVRNQNKDNLFFEQVDKMIQRVNQKYAERMRLYDFGEKQWDTNIITTHILRGMK
ncbi:class I SAM-dependent methyltransferase [Macrococcoides goetzii]|uniref:Class I SAM-dependent methyltransferase n=2 Tax=Macrococcoides goetzii TaxID=1891097 RepID=A0A364JMU1_9STAP|nr:class I SAM-dependent methyltransferase [Macrococcus goetzii]